MQEKPLPSPTQQLQSRLQTFSGEFWRFIAVLYDAVPKQQTYTVTVDPDSVSANSEDVQTVTVAGLTTKDIVTVNNVDAMAEAWATEPARHEHAAGDLV